MRLTGFAGAVLAIVLAMPPMSAVASEVGSQSGEILYDGYGESNVLEISRAADETEYFYFRESEATPGASPEPITAIAPCSHPPVEPPAVVEDPYLARCPVSGVVRMTVVLREGDDRLRVIDSAAVPLMVQGGPGVDDLTGGAGDDNLQGGVGDDTLRGGGGNDRLDFPSGSEEQGADKLEGGPGDDLMNPGTVGRPLEGDTLSGDAGHDTADYGTRTEPLTISLDGNRDDGESGEHDNVLPGTECVDGGLNDDKLIGSSAADCLDGHDGEDIIWGRGGDDMLEGGKNDPGGDNLLGESGSDTMKGGPGDDELAGGEGDDTGLGEGGGDVVEGEGGTDQLEGGTGADAVGGGEGNDWLYGGALFLIGGDGRDDLIGGPGNDMLFGQRGKDLLDGREGSDLMSGGTERDTVTYEGRTNDVFVTLDGQYNDGEAGEHDNVLHDVEEVLGGIQDDTLSADADADTVHGAGGEDLIDGKLGLDQLVGGGAPDVVRADDGDTDDVICGDAADLVIADRRDRVRDDCETIDRPGARGPKVGRNARVRHEGVFRLRLPTGQRFFQLDQNVKIPFGSTVDPKDDVVRLITARNREGARQVTSVSEGRFGVRQGRGRRPFTELRLSGRLPDCRGSSTGARGAARPSPRRLLVEVGEHGPGEISERAELSTARRKRRRGSNVGVRGNNSLGAPFQTKWLTEERCNGTFTKVISGTVLVTDFGLNRTVAVRAGKTYLARSR